MHYTEIEINDPKELDVAGCLKDLTVKACMEETKTVLQRLFSVLGVLLLIWSNTSPLNESLSKLGFLSCNRRECITVACQCVLGQPYGTAQSSDFTDSEVQWVLKSRTQGRLKDSLTSTPPYLDQQ